MSLITTPRFWYRSPETPAPILERALAPLSQIYKLLYLVHQHATFPYKAEIPVICLGNLVAGGTGKTPTALALLALLRQHGLAKNPYFLSRGYGGAEGGPLLVDLARHTAWDVGDEPLILAKHAPTIVAKNRANGVRLAQDKQADLVIMDDGMQNPGLKKDLKLLVINGEMGFGNQKLLPAGPLRQPLFQGLGKADAYILIGADTRGVTALLHKTKPLIGARIIPSPAALPDKTARYLAFAGLGYPEKFFNFLKNDLQLTVVETTRFSDHYPYTPDDIALLKDKARELDAQLITTEKDLMRVPPETQEGIQTLAIETVFTDEAALLAVLKGVL